MDYLFHYTKPEYALKIIQDKTLLFNNINETNDPYENKITNWHVNINKSEDNSTDEMQTRWKYDDQADDSDEDLDKEEADDKLPDENIDETYQDYYENKIHDDTESYYERREYSEEKEDEFNRRLEAHINAIQDDFRPIYFERLNDLKNGIVKTISFAAGELYVEDEDIKGRTGYLYPRMWSQYANNSKGVCIVFKKDVLLESIKKELDNDYYVFDGKIKYVDIFDKTHIQEMINLIKKRNEGIFKYYKNNKRKFLVKNIKENISLYFFRKDSDWCGENEYRILIINKEENNDFGKKIVSFKPDSIESVFLGEDADLANDRDITVLRGICQHEKVRIYKLERDFYKVKYKIKLL